MGILIMSQTKQLLLPIFEDEAKEKWKQKMVDVLVSHFNTKKGNWTQWELVIISYIIDILKHRDPLGLMEFTLWDIRDHKPSIQKKFPNNKNVESSMSNALQSLRDRGEVEFLASRGRYRLSDNGILIEVLKKCRN